MTAIIFQNYGKSIYKNYIRWIAQLLRLILQSYSDQSIFHALEHAVKGMMNERNVNVKCRIKEMTDPSSCWIIYAIIPYIWLKHSGDFIVIWTHDLSDAGEVLNWAMKPHSWEQLRSLDSCSHERNDEW